VVFVHDAGETLESWPPAFVRSLSAGNLAIRYDQRGHGRSSPANNPATIGSLSDDLYALLIDLDLDRADLVGHGLGALVALDQAWSRPETVRKLVLIDANFDALAQPPTTRSPVDLSRADVPTSTLLATIEAPALVVCGNGESLVATSQRLTTELRSARQARLGTTHALSDLALGAIVQGFVAEPEAPPESRKLPAA